MTSSYSTWQVSKREALAERGIVTAKHPLAVEAGLDVLKRGGNAVDAAVTMAFAMGVLNPGANGIGGGSAVTCSGQPGRDYGRTCSRQARQSSWPC